MNTENTNNYKIDLLSPSVVDGVSRQEQIRVLTKQLGSEISEFRLFFFDMNQKERKTVKKEIGKYLRSKKLEPTDYVVKQEIYLEEPNQTITVPDTNMTVFRVVVSKEERRQTTRIIDTLVELDQFYLNSKITRGIIYDGWEVGKHPSQVFDEEDNIVH